MQNLMELALAGVLAWLRQLNLLTAAQFGGTAYSSSFSFTQALDPRKRTAVTSVV